MNAAVSSALADVNPKTDQPPRSGRHPTISAVSTTAWNSTLAPFSAHSGMISSASLWREPVDARAHHHRGRRTRPIQQASCPAPRPCRGRVAEPLRRPPHRRHAAPARTSTGSKCPTASIAIRRPRPRDPRRLRLDPRLHPVELRLVRRADVDREHHPPRDARCACSGRPSPARSPPPPPAAVHRHPLHQSR